MGCWIVPLIAALIGWRTGLLNKMLLGGAMFGVVDHLWYGELFILGPNLGMDLALGGVITIGITGLWGLIEYKPQITQTISHLGFKK